MRILALDIETRPAVVYTWKLYQPVIGKDQIIDPGGMFCYTARWYGKRKIHFHSDHHDGHKPMLQTLWDLLDHADAVLHFNGTTFDVPHINREFMVHGFTPPSPYKQIDLYKTVKRQARFLSNSFDHVLGQLGIEGKETTGGFGLWKACIAGDPKAWARMRRYNVRDVTQLEDAYNRLLPWIPNHPNVTTYTLTDGCTKCGSTNREKRGFNHTATSRYQRYCCKDCGSFYQDAKRDAGVNVKQVA